MRRHSGVVGILATAVVVALAVSPNGVLAQEQLSDPDFDATVAHPAYAAGAGPRVLFDEAHFNFHTASGRYRAFAELLTSDGYRITANRERFTPALLRSADLLVIANALGASDPASASAEAPAFTADEAKAVDDWVRAGGALLLITDRADASSRGQFPSAPSGRRRE